MTKRIRDAVRECIIVAHQEDTSLLRASLESEGFEVREQRRTYSLVESSYTRMARCLLNHRDAWVAVAAGGRPAIVVEADFVPVRGFGRLPLPFDPSLESRAVAWLYSGGPVLYRIEADGRAVGHSSTPVALLMTPDAARGLVAFGDEELAKCGGRYTAWDTYLSHVLRRRMGITTYLVAQQYGEHGGLENPEHVAHGIRGWHQADRLAGSLSFLPSYARGSWLRYRLTRLRAVLRGLARLAAWHYFEPGAFRASNQKATLLRYAIRRWL